MKNNQKKQHIVNPVCGQCIFSGDHFKINGATHLHCEHKDSAISGDKTTGWDTLREWYASGCEAFEKKRNKLLTNQK